MTIYVDIDDTICTNIDPENYDNSTPILDNIQKINAFYEMGHTIVYWTARGTKTGVDWQDITINQFRKWGVKYHKLIFGKPSYDIFIDDKNINAIEIDDLYHKLQKIDIRL